MTALRDRLMTWEGFLLLVLVLLYALNAALSPVFLTVGNQVNLFQLSIEKVIVALAMAFVIINGEIDLSVASVMGLAACLFGWLHLNGVPAWAAIPLVLLAGAACGAFNAAWIVGAGLPSLVVTLATLIGFRGLARILVEDRGIGDFPDWFDRLGQQPVAGLLYAARVGAVRGDVALGFELDIITIVLLGGVSIFGGAGTITGTVLAILIVLALRNGMQLANVTGHVQSGILGLLLILSVMVPTFRALAARLLRRGAPA